MNSSPDVKPLRPAPKREEIDPAAAAATRAKLREKENFQSTALSKETGGFGGQTALG